MNEQHKAYTQLAIIICKFIVTVFIAFKIVQFLFANVKDLIVVAIDYAFANNMHLEIFAMLMLLTFGLTAALLIALLIAQSMWHAIKYWVSNVMNDED